MYLLYFLFILCPPAKIYALWKQRYLFILFITDSMCPTEWSILMFSQCYLIYKWADPSTVLDVCAGWRCTQTCWTLIIYKTGQNAWTIKFFWISFLRWGFLTLPRLVLNLWTMIIFYSQPPSIWDNKHAPLDLTWNSKVCIHACRRTCTYTHTVMCHLTIGLCSEKSINGNLIAAWKSDHVPVQT
jgi:hypothetical protein